jgi:maltoporin
MRRALRLAGLSGLLLTSLVSGQVSAQEPTEDDPKALAEEAEAPPPAATHEAAAPQHEVAAARAAAPAEPVKPTPKFGDLSTHGYFRGGFGASNQKGRQTCFSLALTGGLLAKYRLGNECEVWAEMEFTTVVYAGDDGSVASVHFMPTAFIPTSQIGYPPTGVTSSDLGSPGTGATVAFPNLYADIKGIPWLAGGTAWVGTRYYKRESVYINDFFYWNPSGVGAGIEDVNLGKDLRISYGAFAVDGQPSGSPQLPIRPDLGIRNDLQVRGIKPYESGELQLGLQYIADWSGNKDDTSGEPLKRVTHGGWGVTLQHVQKLLGGDNKLALQYGKGGGTGFGTLSRFYYPDFSLYFSPTEYRIRVVDVLTVQPTEWFGAQAGLVYQRDDLGNAGQKTDWYSAGTRLSFALAKHAKLLGEAGYDRVKKSNGSEPQWLAKFTVAPALTTAKGFWARPELRVFYTWAVWNETARGAKIDSGHLYTTSQLLSGSTFGLQAEAMW